MLDGKTFSHACIVLFGVANRQDNNHSSFDPLSTEGSRSFRRRPVSVLRRRKSSENEGLDVHKVLQILCRDTPAYQADGQGLLLLFGGHSQRSRPRCTHQDWEFCIKLVSGEGS